MIGIKKPYGAIADRLLVAIGSRKDLTAYDKLFTAERND